MPRRSCGRSPTTTPRTIRTAPRTIDFVLTDGDHGGTSNTAQQTVNIIAVPDAPTKIALSSSTADENTDTTAGYSVGTLTTTDPDSSAPFTYTIVGGIDAALFSIGGAGSDELILTDGVLDHETQAIYSLSCAAPTIRHSVLTRR